MYFNHITSLADLKKQYRKLAFENHPDRGGSLEAMQAINAEFTKLYDVWRDRPEVYEDAGGYENDYASATAQEYTSYVYNEYRFEGSNWKKTHEYDNKKICEHVRTFLKEHYPTCKFSVNKSGYNSVNVYLMKADFYPFKDHTRLSGNINHYYLDSECELTDRCREVFRNVIDYVESWNFDDSDIMTDYFHVNFYSDFRIGSHEKDFVYEPVMLGSKDDTFKRKVGPVERAIKEACGQGNCFAYRTKYVYDKETERGHYDNLVDEPKVLCQDNDRKWPVTYSQPSLLKDRLAKLIKVGVICRPYGKMYKGIELVCYTPELQAALDAEKKAEDERERAFYERKKRPSLTLEDKKARATEVLDVDIKIVDYSDKAIAVIGSTRHLSDKLKALGGRFNPRLTCGAGWIFSKKKESELREAFNL